MEKVLELKNLTKRYGSFVALNNASFTVEKGSVYGLLGPNGSGKTTTLGILLDVLSATSGTYSWFGNEPSREDRKRIGAILENPNFYPYLSAEKNLKVVAAIKEVSYDRIEEVLKLVNLYERRKSSFKTYSLGMKQRLAIAAALLNDPEVLVLDEPTNGLDPQGIAEVRELILRIAKQGTTIIISSHMLDEIEKICTHVVVLKDGNTLVSGPVGNVLGDESQICVGAPDLEGLKQILEAHPAITNIVEEQGRLAVSFREDLSPLQLNEYLVSKGITVDHLSVLKKSLETQFLELTNT